MSAVDQLWHLPEKECQQQCANVRPVDISVGHDDDFMIPQLVRIKIIAANRGAKRCNQSANFLASQHSVKARPLNVQNLAAQRQNCLIFTVSPLFGRATRRVTFDDEKFSFCRIALLTIRQFTWQRGNIQRAFAACELARLTGCLARRCGLNDLTNNCFGVGGMFFKPAAQSLVENILNNGTNLT